MRPPLVPPYSKGGDSTPLSTTTFPLRIRGNQKGVLSFGLLAFWLFSFCLPGFAFHESGVANCAACHVMHNSENGTWIDPTAPGGRPMLLKFATATDACLSCHATDLGSVWGSDPLHPPAEKGAGNFSYLSSVNLADGPNSAMHPISGSHAGHNVIAESRGSMYDPTYPTAPGGTYPSSAMSCTSCHDPHGNKNFRMLYGQGHVAAGDFIFVNPAPRAQGISITSGKETSTSHTAYVSGMSAWCANCHGTYHQNGVGTFQHPADQPMGRDIALSYNQYAGSDNPTGGDMATSYLPSVPFEDPSATTAGTTGPSLASRISCVSCHRAHGTSGPNAGRWDFNVVLLRQDGVLSGSFPIPIPYASANQKSLCCKCHANGETHGGNQSCISCHMNNSGVNRALPRLK